MQYNEDAARAVLDRIWRGVREIRRLGFGSQGLENFEIVLGVDMFTLLAIYAQRNPYQAVVHASEPGMLMVFGRIARRDHTLGLSDVRFRSEVIL